MKNNVRDVIRIAILLLVLISCSKQDSELSESVKPQKQLRETSEGEIVLGEQLTNPYSVEAFANAFENLGLDVDLGFGSQELAPSHYYIKVIPADSTEHNILTADSTLELFSYPLDYEIEVGGTYYHDDYYPEDSPTPQYLVLENDRMDVLENYNFEILSEILLQENDFDWCTDSIYTLLEKETFRLAGHDYHESGRGAKWYPYGKIRAYDDAMNQLIPLHGVKVRARNWFTIKSDLTDVNGDYIISNFNENTGVDLSIIWETNQYDIRDGAFKQAEYTGPNEINQQAWNLDILGSMHKSVRISAVHRAAYRYYYKNTYGLKRPDKNRHLKLRYYHENGTSMMIGWWPVIAEIRIYGTYTNSYLPIHGVLSTTFHEIAHASHITLRGNIASYGLVKSEIYESWAEAVEWYLTEKEYLELGFNNIYTPGPEPGDGISGEHNQWRNYPESFEEDDNYTPLFIDLVDDFNQSVEFGNQTCNFGGTYDGANCFVLEAPTGETAFIHNNKFYYTPVGSSGCPVAGTSFDGSNCFVQSIPSGANAFIHNNKMYFYLDDDPNHPFDPISGFTMQNLEENVVKPSNNINDVKINAKAHKPSNVQNSEIDDYINEHYNAY